MTIKEELYKRKLKVFELEKQWAQARKEYFDFINANSIEIAQAPRKYYEERGVDADELDRMEFMSDL